MHVNNTRNSIRQCVISNTGLLENRTSYNFRFVDLVNVELGQVCVLVVLFNFTGLISLNNITYCGISGNKLKSRNCFKIVIDTK